MKRIDRDRLEAKSLLCFGVKSRYKTIMMKGRPEFDYLGNLIGTHSISIEEIEDTMNFILKERRIKQEAIFKQMEEEKNERLREENNDTES